MDAMKSISQTDELLCRTCLKVIPSTNETIYLFNKFLDESKCTTLVDFISSFTLLEIQESDGLSPFICVECYEKLKDIHEYRKLCIASSDFLYEQNIFSKNSVKIKIEHFVEPKFVDVNLDNMKDEQPDIFMSENDTEQDEKEEQKKKKSKSKTQKKYDDRNVKSDFIKITCNICQKLFYKQDTFDGHMRKHNGLKPFVCEVCGKDFTKKTSLKYHINANHPQEGDKRTEYICGYDGCGKVYSIRQSFKNHLFTIHVERPDQVKRQRAVCEHCGKSFTSNTGLKKHSSIHTGILPFKCHLCPKAYATTNKLKLHIMRHEGIKNHICPTCGLRKTTMSEMRVHMNCHTKEKQYPCDKCSVVFSTNTNRTRHIQIVHMGVKDYTCEYCNKSFGKAYILRRHILTHTGEKPHACKICGKQFIQLFSLRSHMNTHDKANKLKKKK